MEEQPTVILAQLFRILAGKTPIEAGTHLIAQNVISHMDERYTFHGINAWANWISFIRSRRRVSDLDLICEQMVANPDGTITASGYWKARYKGREVVSNALVATYRVQDGKVVEIWTKRKNYILIFGPMMKYEPGWVTVMVYLGLWNRLPGRLDLRIDPLAS
jgi:hypothetical protein